MPWVLEAAVQVNCLAMYACVPCSPSASLCAPEGAGALRLVESLGHASGLGAAGVRHWA